MSDKKTPKLGKKMKRVLIGLGIIVALCVIGYGILYYYIVDSLHLKKISKFKASSHFISSSPRHGETIHQLMPISIHFAYPLTKISTISTTAGDWEDGVGPITLDASKTTMTIHMNPKVKDAIYTVNYTACFIDKYCDYGYFQYRLKRATQQ